jgi:hypothetical protein
MFARKAVFSSIGRATAMVAVAAVVLAVAEPSLARAGSAGPATDFSSRARVYHHGGGGAAAAAAFAGIVGTGLAIAATQNRRAYYDDGYYDGGPAYYGGGPVYYGGPGYYDPGYGYGRASEFGGQPYPNY